MILHNIKQSIRSMRKNKVFTFFNITGFAVAFAVVITIMLFAVREYSTNSFIPNSEKVYRLVDTENKATLIDNSIVPKLKNDYPELKEVISLFHFSINEKVLSIKSAENKKHLWVKNIVSTSGEFFNLMGLKVLASKTEKPFSDINSLVLSKSTALKMFGSIDVIDKYLEFKGKDLSISAVVEDIPTHSTITADLYCHEDNKGLVVAGSDTETGRFYIGDVYISLNGKANIDNVLAKINKNFPANKSKTKSVTAQAVKDIYFSKPIDTMGSDKIGNKSLVWLFITIAILTLIMAIFNYVNFTIAQQLKTLKNSGIRIVNGATKKEIGNYYIVNVLLSVGLAFFIAIFITYLTLPLSSKLLATDLSPIWLLDVKFLALILALLLLTASICSILPIAFINRLNIQSLFGKSQLKSRKHSLKTAMTIAQITISIILVVGFITINKQLRYVKTADVGFEKQRLVQLNLPREFQKYDVLRNAIDKLPFVDALSYTAHGPGGGTSGGYLYKENGEKIRVRTMLIDEHFIETFGLKLIHGSKFTENDLNKACYISETAYKQLDRNIEGKQFGVRSVKGVVNDLNISSLHSEIVPVCYLFIKHYSALNVKLKEGNLKQQLQEIEKVWSATINGVIFNYNFYDDYYNSLYQKEEHQAQALTLFSIIAFIITCLGLLGQILQTTQNRIKEIGIRKINGATIKEVVALLNSGFVISVVIAFVIATPVAYYAMNKWLENFAYKTTLSWWIFALAGLSALVIALLTVSWQSYRAASRNPVEALRYE